MEAEVIAVGTEILLGEIVNTNAAFVAQALAQLGIESHHQQVVGDNQARLDAAITLAESRSDMILILGGLGPTPDDLSKQTLSAHLDRPLVVDKEAMAKLDQVALQQQRTLTANNRLQAMYPKGATVLPNTIGLAVGAWIEQAHKRYILLPGPPKELRPMVTDVLLPILEQAVDDHNVLVSRTLRFFGIGESQLTTDLADLIASQTNPTLATYIKDYEVTVRVTAAGETQVAAEQLLQPLIKEILKRDGQFYYGEGEHNSLPQIVAAELSRQNLQITAAESLTAGAFQAMLGSIPGISAHFSGGFVTYALATKASFLAIDPALLHRYGVVSAETAKAMATHARDKAQADIAVSFTGVAGPDELEGNPAGTVWIGVAVGDSVEAQEFHFQGGRNDVRGRAVLMGFFLVLKRLQQK